MNEYLAEEEHDPDVCFLAGNLLIQVKQTRVGFKS